MKQDNQKYCQECGELINIKAEICPKCGVRQTNMSASINLGTVTASGRSRFVAAMLALFFGCIGLQCFYLGQTGSGIMAVLFCWTGIPAIFGFIHCLMLLVMSDEAFYNKYK